MTTLPAPMTEPIPMDDELNTLLRLNGEFPLAVSHDNLSEYRNGFVNWHKQGFIELSIITEGSVTVNLLNHQEKINAGEGFLILPGILHSIRSDETLQSVKYETMIYESCLLTGFRGSYFEKNYYKPEIINKNGFFHFFVNKEPLQSYVTDFWDIFHDTYWGNPKFQNQIQQKLQKIWIALWEYVISNQTKEVYKADNARLFKMIKFLQKNYQKKFELDELCEYMNLSRSACCRYLKKMMNMSISDYIFEYRMSQAIFMLNNTDKGVTEIALQSGFASASYFIMKFKEKMGITPFAYKRKSMELSY